MILCFDSYSYRPIQEDKANFLSILSILYRRFCMLVFFCIMGVFLVGFSGCSETTTLSLKRSKLDPFVIPTLPPLTIPPDYSLKPPSTSTSSFENTVSQSSEEIAKELLLSPQTDPSQQSATIPEGQTGQQSATIPEGQTGQQSATIPEGQTGQQSATIPEGQTGQQSATIPEGQTGTQQNSSSIDSFYGSSQFFGGVVIDPFLQNLPTQPTPDTKPDTKEVEDPLPVSEGLGEQALLERIGKGDPNIRQILEEETDHLIYASQSWIDTLIFWKESESPHTLVDDVREFERIKALLASGGSLTEGETPYIIRRTRTTVSPVDAADTPE